MIQTPASFVVRETPETWEAWEAWEALRGPTTNNNNKKILSKKIYKKDSQQHLNTDST
ncbi:MAG TPA: hypothetical protein VL027_09730 [Spongiibacteraceae bacterium]|nr:hypothetical protein [Spongiibacteraceae bacterium]